MKQRTIASNQQGALVLELVLAIVVIAVIGFALYQAFAHNRTSSDTPAKTAITSAQSELKTYTDAKTGLTLQYPKELTPNDTAAKNQQLTIAIAKIDDLQGPRDDPDLVRAEIAALARGDASIYAGPAVPSKILTLPDGAVGASYLILREFDACDIQFTRRARIYRNNYQIAIELRDFRTSDLIKANAKYFERTGDCSPDSLSKDDIWAKPDQFAADLATGRTDPLSLGWYAAFDRIIASIKF